MIPKFRAWDKELKTMFEVKSLVFTLNLATIASKNDLFPSRTCSFDDIILMQSTGLFDKNGVEIWVGDILEVRDTSCFGGLYHGAVEYLDNWGVYGFNLFEAKVLSTNKFKKHSLGFLTKEFGNCFTLAEASSKSNYSYKVIGNIHTNPDLLESVEE